MIGEPRLIADSPGDAMDVALAWTGAGVTAAWSDTRHGRGEIYMQRLLPDGARLGDALRITHDAAASLEPVLTWNNARYTVAWIDRRGGPADAWLVQGTIFCPPVDE